MLQRIPVKRQFDSDNFFGWSIRVLAILVVVLFVAIVASLIWHSSSSLHKLGLEFITSFRWSPSQEHFGALAIIIGTLTTSLIAMLIAIPLSLGIAISITEWLPKPVGLVLARLIELMAGIPSIIYGMWGLFIFVPLMADYVQPPLIELFDGIPLLNFVFGGMPIGIGVFTAGIVLALMVVPLISSMMRDVLNGIPIQLKEASYSLGATRWEVVRHILVPYVRAGMLGSVILGFGRALGETMAVTFVIGNSHKLFSALFMPGTTISATIANEFSEAYGELYQSALIELGLLLFVITLMVLAISRYFLKKAGKRGGSI